jgi:NADH-quinone oxidoreductase subunit L
MNSFQLGCLCLGAPFLGAIFAYIMAHNNRKAGQWICVNAIGICFLSGCVLFYKIAKSEISGSVHLFTWIKAETIRVNWGFLFDSLSTLMILIVSFISLLVHIYSVGYMRDEPDKLSFFGHLNLFTFMMIVLVSAPNMLQLFCGWEGVGLASYLLIGYWHEKPSATTASIKAFVMNRIGDIGLVLALGAIFTFFHTLDFGHFFSLLKETECLPKAYWLNIIGLLLLLGAMGKSGQFGLHTWLPDAMEAPTPVSALLHAATMVTAGVFLIIRFSPLFELAPIAKQAMMFIGLTTGFFAGFVALTQTDIKKIIAYSTCSQLGMMFMACAAGAYSVAFLHLFTHAFFKALLFLCAGSVIHAMSHEQNIFKMGGLKSYLPSSYYTMIIGTLALTGFPFFAGYYSKDLIFESIYLSSIPFAQVYYGLCLLLTLITGLYSWRLLFLVFHGKSKADEHVIAHIHKTGKLMQYPINILAAGSVIVGYIGVKLLIDQSLGFSWDKNIIENISVHVPIWVKLFPLVFSCLALFFCYYMYIQKPFVPLAVAQKFPNLHKFLKNKFYIDEFYYHKIAIPFIKLGSFLYKAVDRNIIDKYGPDGFANASLKLGGYMQKPQTGYLFHYGFIAILGIVLILGVYLAMQSFPHLSKMLLYIMGRL